MKKVFAIVIFLLSFGAFNNAQAQTDEDALRHHNELLKVFFTKFKGQQVSSQMIVNEINIYASSNGVPLIDESFQKYITNFMKSVKNPTAFANKLLAEKKVSQGYRDFAVYFDKLALESNSSDTDPTIEKLLKVVEVAKQSSKYTTLGETDKISVDFFLKAVVNSGKFWLSDEANDGSGVNQRCRWGCWICVILADALGFGIGLGACTAGGPVTGTICGIGAAAWFSFVAKCCWCGTCPSITINCFN